MPKKKNNITSKFKEREAWAIIMFIFSIIISISMAGYDFNSSIHPDSINGNEESGHLLGKFGIFISYFLITKTIGIFAIVFPIILFMIAYAMFFKKELSKYFKKSTFLFLLAVMSSTLFDRILALYFPDFTNLSGVVPMMISNTILGIFGTLGFWLLIPDT